MKEWICETYARVRKDLINDDLFPPCSHSIDDDLWRYDKFEVWNLYDECEDFNMVILHPITNQKLEVYSIDFDFERNLKNEKKD